MKTESQALLGFKKMQTKPIRIIKTVQKDSGRDAQDSAYRLHYYFKLLGIKSEVVKLVDKTGFRFCYEANDCVKFIDFKGE